MGLVEVEVVSVVYQMVSGSLKSPFLMGYQNKMVDDIVDHNSAIAAADANAGQQDSSLFSSAMGFLSNMNKDDDVDEDEVKRKHDEAYNQNNAGGMSANSIGS